MDRQTAADLLDNLLGMVDDSQGNDYDTALRMGVQALKTDAVKVVRCKDCKYQDKGQNEVDSWNVCTYRPWQYVNTYDDHFCSDGERK